MPAATFRAFTTGRKLRLKEVVAILQGALESGDSELSTELDRLKRQSSSLKDNADSEAQ